jgi:hypothetical protein
MTGGQLQKLLDKGGFSQRGAAKELGINERHMRRYIAGEAVIPKHIEIAVRCICEHRAKEVRRD